MPESEKRNRFLVGYALPERKLGCFMVPTFINHAKDRGIDFVAIDAGKPLTDQSPVDCIIHKLYTDDWKVNLREYTVNNPNTVIIDPSYAIERLQNRISMLEFITELKIPNLSIPNQLLVDDSSSLSSVIATGKLNFPMIAKPVVVDGSAKSHKMSLVLNELGLTKGLDLESPVVLQQFVNHGGVIFKVYVAGDYVKCVKRQSLTDISEEMLEKTSSESSPMSFAPVEAISTLLKLGSKFSEMGRLGSGDWFGLTIFGFHFGFLGFILIFGFHWFLC